MRALFARAMVTLGGTIADAALLLEGATIAAAGPRAAVGVPAGTPTDDYGDALLAPGLIDLHVHGGAGVDTMRAERRDLERMSAHLARHGVTGFLATTVSAPWEELLRAVEQLGRAGAEMHLEGPFLSPTKRGVHPEGVLLAPTVERLQALWAASQGRIRMITVAPELEGAREFIAAAVKLGICISLGHSNATAAEAEAAIAAGACHVTHTFNAMRAMHQREPGLLGVALAEPELSAEIIADGVHVDPLLVQLFLHAKAPGKAVLVSDGISATGMGDGTYALGELQVQVQGSRCCYADTLAGSVLVLDEAVRNVQRWTGWKWAEVLRLGSENPATLMGWGSKGQLAPGADADVAVFSPSGVVIAAYKAGRLVS